ncbi:MAG: T9SS type B sorting domain-containing protein [Chitinophagaceae bacterium]
MKQTVLILALILSAFAAKADHITGGEMFYMFTGVSGGQYTYSVTLKLFMRCNSGRQFPDPAIISVFDKGNGTRIRDISVGLSSQELIQLTSFDPCISNPPAVCYEVAYYNFSVSLPASLSGYTLASQVNYRIRGINNLDPVQVGATYTCEIPGTAPLPDAPANHSAMFTGSDLVVVCAGNYFSYSFAADDADNDDIRYSFCTAYVSTNGGINGSPPGVPPYPSVPYFGPDYSQSTPLGSQVSIDPETGLITGIAPPGGIYVVTVCAEEIRNGVVIATQRKDLQINIADCSVAAAVLDPDYMLCRDTRSITLRNKSTSPLIISHDWEVFNAASSPLFTSTGPELNYTFPANGTYTVRLIVNRGQDCSDTTTALVYVYPGLVPGFESEGICITRPTLFTDRTTLLSGSVNSWKWDFGEPTALDDVSTDRHPSYTYPVQGLKNIRLIVSTTDGCRDTVFNSITIIDKPPITLAFRDTLICVNDAVQLQAAGTGDFSWSPPVNISNANTATPTVSPVTTTMYYADLDTEGCKNRDSVNVRVISHVSLAVMADTIICSGDTVRLRVVSDGLQYAWTPAGQIMDPAAQNPLVVSPASTPYQVTATVGGCSTGGTILVTCVPYPLANAGADTTICYNTPALLHGTTNGSSWQWSPAVTLLGAATTHPLAYPATTASYIFTTFDTRGCPKPGRDTVMVTVLPKIIPFAGRDTAVVINQPLQLHASGGERYRWFPPTDLSDAAIADPVALFNEPAGAGLRYNVRVYNQAGCYDSAFITIKVFSTLPEVFVPTAFTPNNDGRNDRLIPVAVGIKQIDYFSIYNRWGQLVFTTTANGHGWDGKIGGQPQPSNTFVWVVKAIDFNGTPYFRKGTFVLIR